MAQNKGRLGSYEETEKHSVTAQAELGDVVNPQPGLQKTEFDASASDARMAHPDRHEITAPARHIIFDISDLVQFLQENRVPTGIQRVQLNIIHYAITLLKAQCNPIIVFFEKARNGWVCLTDEEFFLLHAAAEAGDEVDEEAFHALVQRMAMRESLFEHLKQYPKQDRLFLVNLGSSWWIENYILKIRELRARFSVCYIPMIHDCIPLVTPWHCAEALVREFRAWFADICLEADAILTNSIWSRKDILRQLSLLDPEISIPVHPVALNGDMSRHQKDRSLVVGQPLHHVLPAGRDFVLFVATFESRKNHILVFQAWHRLIERYGLERTPFLLCLGRAGWQFDSAAEYLRQNPVLNERIRLVSSVSDQALPALYENCLFSIFNSFYEGWGLPITESLAFGTLPLVARNTSLTEAGGSAAVYFNTDDLADLLKKLELLIFNQKIRETARSESRKAAKTRSWQNIAHEMLQQILATEGNASIRYKRFMALEQGRITPLRRAAAETPFGEVARRSLLRDGLHWHRPEDWGCWTAPGVACLRFNLPAGLVGQPMKLFIRLRGTALDTRIRIRLFHGEDGRFGPWETLIGRGRRQVLCFVLRAAGDAFRVEIDCGVGSSLGPGDRDVGVGVTHLMVCAAEDRQAEAHFTSVFPEFSMRSSSKRRKIFQRIEIPLK